MATPDDAPARRDFHLALSAVVLPFAAFAVSLALALKHRGALQRGDPDEARWARRLVALAALDFLVLLATLAFATGLLHEPAPPPPAMPDPHLGTHLRRMGVTWGVTLALLAAIAAAGARRKAALDPPALRLWLVFAGALAAADAAVVGTTLALAAVLHGSALPSIAGVFAGSAVLLVIAAGWRHALFARGALARDPAGASTLGTIVSGVGYVLAGVVRVGIVLAAATPLLRLPETDPGGDLRALLHHGSGPAGTAVIVAAAVILAPIGEETLFRGVLLPWLGRYLSAEGAAWASAWVFAAAHLRYGPHVLVVVVYGLALAWARMRSGGLRAPIALHMIINAAALGFALLER